MPRPLAVAALALSAAASAQVPDTDPLFRRVAALDSVLFEVGFNGCDLEAMSAVVSEELAFYHDQGGPQDKAAFMRATRENICEAPGPKPIRRLEPGSVEVFPMYRGGELYGAIQSGTHRFYLDEPGRPLRPTGVAAFTNLWLAEGDAWRLAHALSYDHRAVETE